MRREFFFFVAVFCFLLRCLKRANLGKVKRPTNRPAHVEGGEGEEGTHVGSSAEEADGGHDAGHEGGDAKHLPAKPKVASKQSSDIADDALALFAALKKPGAKKVAAKPAPPTMGGSGSDIADDALALFANLKKGAAKKAAPSPRHEATATSHESNAPTPAAPHDANASPRDADAKPPAAAPAEATSEPQS